ncbi:MAG: DNA cytosine methyltransferase [Candidatus Fonsibacter sp.]
MVVYSDVRHRSTKDVPRCDVFFTLPPCVTCSYFGKCKGPHLSQGRLLFDRVQYIVEKLPREVIIRGLTLKRNATLLVYGKGGRGLQYSIHIRILCTSHSRAVAGATRWASAGRK